MPAAIPVAHVTALAPMVHVADVDASIAFYALLGFRTINRIDDPRGRAGWAMLQSRDAVIMLASASGPVAPAEQAVLFYFYGPDLAALRVALASAGVPDAGHFTGQDPMAATHATARWRRAAFFDITHPPYMPVGQLRIHDPDGYCLLVGQLDPAPWHGSA